jgi:hypothetical protein
MDLTLTITALAQVIACHSDEDELSLAAAAFTQLGDTLATISVQRDICNKKNAADIE